VSRPRNRVCLAAHTGTGVQEADWVFKTTFDVNESELEKDCVDLYFEGLDTYCTVVLVRLAADMTSQLTL
jgi:hypothetical protein